MVNTYRKITSDPWVLEAVYGYKLELTQPPYQPHRPVSMANKETSQMILKEVQLLLEKESIRGSGQWQEGRFLLQDFSLPKKGGSDQLSTSGL